MNKEEIRRLFPLIVEITQDIIDSGKNIGEELLKKHLPKELHDDIFWGLSIGHVASIYLKVEQAVGYNGKQLIVPLYLQRPDISKPITITFNLRK